MNALVVGNGSYIVRPCGHDLHSPTILSLERAKSIKTVRIKFKMVLYTADLD